MKVLFNCLTPFSLAHGGVQIQIEQTKAALSQTGVEVDFFKWWDAGQRADLIHHFGGASLAWLEQARAKHIPVILTSMLSATCNRSDGQLSVQSWLTRALLGLPVGESLKRQLQWRVYATASRNLVGLEAERKVLESVYGVPRENISLIPIGLSDSFIHAGPGDRTAETLVCVGTITAQKNCVPLAQLARAAQVPVLFVGKPYFESDPYWLEFQGLVDGHWVRHQPHVGDEAAMVALLHHARGAVVMSDFENWSLTAHEAAACGLPLLLPDLNWSRERFGSQAHYFGRVGFHPRNVEILKQFYNAAPGLPAPAVKLFSWAEVAGQLKTVYERVLNQ